MCQSPHTFNFLPFCSLILLNSPPFFAPVIIFFCSPLPVLPHHALPHPTAPIPVLSRPILPRPVTPRLSLSSHPILSSQSLSMPSFSLPPLPFFFFFTSCRCGNIDLAVEILTNTMWIFPRKPLDKQDRVAKESQAPSGSDCLNYSYCVF